MLKKRIALAATAMIALWPVATRAAEVPQGYDASYADILAAAEKEGAVVVYGTTDSSAVEPMLNGFKDKFGIEVEYHDLNSLKLFNRVISETAAGVGTGDVVWSSAMDLQAKLIDDGFATEYVSQEDGNVPDWAKWKGAYGITVEPAAIMYNKRLVPEEDVPSTRAEFAELLRAKADTYADKVVTYDPETAGVGFLFLSQDAAQSDEIWDLVRAMAGAKLKLSASSGGQIERVASGEYLFSYNIIGSYVLAQQQRNEALGLIFPEDYTLSFSRIAFISSGAKHPNAAKLFLDYMLSAEGQEKLTHEFLGTVRDDVEYDALADAKGNLKPIAINEDLLTYLDQTKRLEFLAKWNDALRGAAD